MEKQNITIYDVAREAGVSMATVSRVVNGNPNVKPSTRKKVEEVIDKLGYRPNAVARGLASKKTTTVGVIIPDVTNLYYSSLARGMDDIATMYKYNIILTNSDDNAEKEVSVLNNLLSKQVDGIIFMGTKVTDQMRKEFSRTNTPIVLAGTLDPEEEISSVNINYEEAMEESVSYLINNGHERIAFIFNSFENPVDGIERLKGYKNALNKADLPFDEDLLILSSYSYKDGDNVAEKLRERNATAAVFADDEIAAGALNSFYDRGGMVVPDDFELITSNNSKLVEIARPQITTVVQPLYDIGAVAMRLLTKLMRNEEIDENTVRLPHHILHKGTTKH